MAREFSASNTVTRRDALRAAGRIVLMASTGALVTACTTGGPATVGSDVIEVTVTAAGNVNPGPTGGAAPLALQIYTLRSAGRFGTLDYFAIRDQGPSLLASDIVDQQSLSIRPGQTTTVTLRGTGATTLAVAAGYRDIDNARWRATTGLGDDGAFVLRAGRASIAVGRG